MTLACRRCDHVPEPGEHPINGNSLCTECQMEAWKKERALLDLKRLAPNHPTFYRRQRGSLYGYSSHTCTPHCPHQITLAIREEGAE